MKFIKKITIIFALAVFLLSGFRIVAAADEQDADVEDPVYITQNGSGLSCGENVSWRLYNHVLTISGTGTMTNYTNYNNAPWFISSSEIYSIVIKSGVTGIGNYAFQSCSNAISVSIPSTVKRIGVRAFQGCSSLTAISLPSSLTTICNYAFIECSSLASLQIPSYVNSIGIAICSGCTSLSGLTVSSSNSYYDSRNGCNAIIRKSDSTLMQGCASSTIPGTVVKINQEAFYGTSLAALVLPKSVTEIGTKAFSCCASLSSISVASGNTVFSSKNNCNAVLNKSGTVLRFGCKNTVIPASVTTIDSYSFMGAAGLENITIPNGVTCINANAFRYCTGLKEFVAPSGITYIGESAFYGCTGLETADICEGPPYLEDQTFCGCINLRTVYLPSSVEHIYLQAFSGCSSLENVYYNGYESDRAALDIHSGNNMLEAATWHCNDCSHDTLICHKAVASTYTAMGNIRYWSCSLCHKYFTDAAGQNAVSLNDCLTDYLTPEVPVLGCATMVSSGIKVEWNAASGADYYSVYRKTASGSWKCIKSVVTATSYTDTTVDAGVIYSYSVSSYNSTSRKRSGYDTTGLSAISLSKPATIKIEMRSDGMKIRWSSVAGVTSYRIYRREYGESSWHLIKSKCLSRYYIDTTAVSGKLYYYRVRGYCSTVRMLGAASDSVRGCRLGLVNAPVLKTASGKVSVSWTQVSGADAYAIYRKESGGTWQIVKRIAQSGNSNRKWIDKTVQTGKTYYYIVRPYRITNGIRFYGQYDANAPKITVKK